MTTTGRPASLTGDLLARKGHAAPANLGAAPLARQGAINVAPPRVIEMGTGCNGAAPARAGAPCDDRAGVANPADRARLTLRLDEARHRRLKVTSAYLQRSQNDIIMAALDAYLEHVSPEILGSDCACLASAMGARRRHG